MKIFNRRYGFLLLVAATLLTSGTVRADCEHNGVTVPEGTRVGVLVCQNGKWIEG